MIHDRREVATVGGCRQVERLGVTVSRTLRRRRVSHSRHGPPLVSFDARRGAIIAEPDHAHFRGQLSATCPSVRTHRRALAALFALAIFSPRVLRAPGPRHHSRPRDRPGLASDRRRERVGHRDPSGVNKTARTDKDGRFTVTFPSAEGDYWVTIQLIGLAARRFEIKRLADEDVLIADVRLQKPMTILGPVRVQGQRPTVAARQRQHDGRRRGPSSASARRGSTSSSLGDLGRARGDAAGRDAHSVGRRRALRLLGLRPRRGGEQLHAERPRDERQHAAARRGGVDDRRDVAVRRLARRIQRRTGQHAVAVGRQLHRAHDELHRHHAADAVVRPRRAVARARVDEGVARRAGCPVRSSSIERSTTFRSSTTTTGAICERCSTSTRRGSRRSASPRTRSSDCAKR